MKNDSEKKIVRNYYIHTGIALAVYIAALVAVYVILPNTQIFLKLMLFVLCMVCAKLILNFLAYKHFLYILFVELYASKFAAVMKPSRWFAPSATYRMMASYYSGEHAETVNICTKMLKGKPGAAQKLLYTVVLARTYFELGDNEKLRAVCTSFSAYTFTQRNCEKLRAKYPVMEFFAHYLGGDLAACEEAAKKGMAAETRVYAKLAAVQSKFFHAVASYRLGNAPKAQILFEEVIYEAPKTHFARMAHTYLDAIALEDANIVACAEVLPDEKFEVYNKRTRTYLKVRRIILAVLMIILGISLFWLSMLLIYIS
ncbi:MAG: hypothetical protein IJW21_06220 [Clostridia bacterium]|nr:hypothetical protein [Clostridia bacterium]